MKFSIDKSNLPSFKQYDFEAITVTLYREEQYSEWLIDWKNEITFADKNDCWIIKTSELTAKQQSDIDEYVYHNQAVIDKQVDDESRSNRADYEYNKYLEERGM